MTQKAKKCFFDPNVLPVLSQKWQILNEAEQIELLLLLKHSHLWGEGQPSSTWQPKVAPGHDLFSGVLTLYPNTWQHHGSTLIDLAQLMLGSLGSGGHPELQGSPRVSEACGTVPRAGSPVLAYSSTGQ